MAMLTKLDILKVKELKKQLVPVPEWGGEVWVQEMTGEQRDLFDSWVSKSNDMRGIRMRVVVATVVDDKGKPLFTDLDIPDLALKSGKVIENLSNVGMLLSGLSEEAKKVEIKNSEEGPVVDSSSDSVVN